jgi:hypothetical protein
MRRREEGFSSSPMTLAPKGQIVEEALKHEGITTGQAGERTEPRRTRE